MSRLSAAWWLCLGLALAGRVWAETAVAPAANTPAAAETPARYDTGGPRGVEAVGGLMPVLVQGAGNSPGAQGMAVYEENHWLEDFEVHFLVSLPFTALYSYLAVSGLDATVQGRFPTSFRTADMWVVTGLALGGSLAVALGSINRVPDQSVPRLAQGACPDFSGEAAPPWRLALVQIDY
jgi:hypothetical protein